MAQLFGQEAMLGMLFAGILLRNLFPSIVAPIPHSWTSVLWTIALCSVISRAGLSLQTSKVLPHIYQSFLLGTFPVLTEAIILSFLARQFFELPTTWSYTLSFGVASISPGVVVPLILKLVDSGWQKSRLPPLLLTSLGLDVLVGTAGFGIALASCFGHVHEHEDIHPKSFHQSWISRGIEEVSVGFLLGGGLGLLAFGYSRMKWLGTAGSYLVFLTSSCTMIWYSQ